MYGILKEKNLSSPSCMFIQRRKEYKLKRRGKNEKKRKNIY